MDHTWDQMDSSNMEDSNNTHQAITVMYTLNRLQEDTMGEFSHS